MEISTKSYKRVSVVTVAGRIDSTNASEFGSELKSIADASGHNMILDLAGIEYVSSMGVREMITAMKAARKKGGEVSLANPSDIAAEVIQIAGLNHVFTIHDDVVTAVGSY